MVNEPNSGPRGVLIFSFAGFLSGLLSSWLLSLGYLLGAVFGVAIAAYLALSGVLRNFWKLTLIVCVSAVAYVMAWFTAFLVETACRSAGFSTSPGDDAVSWPVMLVAGVVGAYVLAGSLIRLIHPEIKTDTYSKELLGWSLIGGLLAILGWSLGPVLSACAHALLRVSSSNSHNSMLWNALYPTPGNWYSLLVVWQTGMAVVLGILLRRFEARTSPKEYKRE